MICEMCGFKTEKDSPADDVKKPPGEAAAVVVAAGAAAAPATVTPVLSASDAGIEERPGVIEAATAVAAGVLSVPHQQPHGAFIHWVTYAVTTEEEHADTAVTVV